MRHLTSINQKAKRIEALHDSHPREGGDPASATDDVVALQGAPPAATGPFIPMGCSFVFAPGWEVDSTGGTAGLCQPVERDLFDCHLTCFWPAHVPDLYNHAPEWTAKCANAQKDWRKIDLVFP